MKYTAETWVRWTKQIERIVGDFRSVAIDNHIFQEFRDAVLVNGDWIDENHGSLFLNFVRRSYLTHVAFGVRRQVSVLDGDVSLLKVMDRMAKCADQLTFDEYLRQFPRDENDAPWQEVTFGRLSKDGAIVSAERIRDDMVHLKQLGADLKKIANKHFAHLNQNPPPVRLLYSEMHTSVEEVDRLIRKYRVFLTGVGTGSLVPTIQFRWKQIFEVPLVQPGKAESQT